MPSATAVGRVGHRRLLVEQRVEADRAALGPGEVAHGVDQRGEGVADGDRDDDEQGRDRAAGDGGVDEQGGEQRRHGGGHEQRRRDQGATAALPAHRPAQRVVGVGEPAGGGAVTPRWPAARRPGGPRGR